MNLFDVASRRTSAPLATACYLLALIFSGTTVNAIPPGSVDPSFDPGDIDGDVRVVKRTAGGKWLIAGDFTSVGGEPRSRIARLEDDGALDAAFEGPAFNGTVFAMDVQSDGRIVAGGSFTSPHSYLVRLNADGTVDETFENGSASGIVYALAVQEDDRIVAGGRFTSIGGASRSRIARLNVDGTADTTFGEDFTGANHWVYSVALQADGKILLGGQFTLVFGEERGHVARLNPDGTIDESFGADTAGANDNVWAIASQGDGRVAIGGEFTSVDGELQRGIARLQADGSRDPSFAASMAFGSFVRSVVQEPEGRLLIGGSFTEINDEPRGRIARLQPDGELDLSIPFGVPGADGTVFSVALDEAGRVAIGGGFTTVNDVPAARLVRLLREELVLPPTDRYAYDEAGRLIGAYYDNGVTITWLYGPGGDLLGRTVTRFVDTAGNGIDDDWELEHFGQIGIDPDMPSASPGMTVLMEFLAGTDPNDPDDFLRVTDLADETGIGFRIEWPAVEGRVYRVQYTDTLLPHDWRDLPGDVVGGGGIAVKTDESAHEADRRFYRVVAIDGRPME